MVKTHLKTKAAPKTWRIPRKVITFTARPNPGAHSYSMGLPISLILKNFLKIAKTTKEAKYILSNKSVLVDGKKVRDVKFQVGLMDVLSLPDMKQSFRILLNKKGNLYLLPIDDKESNYKICKVMGKTILKGKKEQLNLHDSKNILSKNKIKVGDSLIFTFGKGAGDALEFKEGATIYLIGGSHIAHTGLLKSVIPGRFGKDEILIESNGKEIRTLKKYAFVIGDKSAKIKIENE